MQGTNRNQSIKTKRTTQKPVRSFHLLTGVRKKPMHLHAYCHAVDRFRQGGRKRVNKGKRRSDCRCCPGQEAAGGLGVLADHRGQDTPRPGHGADPGIGGTWSGPHTVGEVLPCTGHGCSLDCSLLGRGIHGDRHTPHHLGLVPLVHENAVPPLFYDGCNRNITADARVIVGRRMSFHIGCNVSQ